MRLNPIPLITSLLLLSITAAAQLDSRFQIELKSGNFIPVKNGELSLLSKYVSKQYLDNTSNNARSLNAFFVQDVRAIYTIKNKGLKEINIIAQLNNVFGKKYEPNGYSFSYFVGGETVTENYYFPMAGRNFMLGLNISL